MVENIFIKTDNFVKLGNFDSSLFFLTTKGRRNEDFTKQDQIYSPKNSKNHNESVQSAFHQTKYSPFKSVNAGSLLAEIFNTKVTK